MKRAAGNRFPGRSLDDHWAGVEMGEEAEGRGVGAVGPKPGGESLHRALADAAAAGAGPDAPSAELARALEAGADVDWAGADGVTAVMEAAAFGLDACLTQLIDAGGGFDACREDRSQALWRAVCFGREGCARILIDAGASVSCGVFSSGLACMAVGHGMPALLAKLIEAGVDFDAKGPEGEIPLALAAELGFVECLRVLIEAEARIDQGDFEGVTAAMFAAKGGELECLGALLAAGADLAAKDLDGGTAWDHARRMGREDSLGMLSAAAEKRALREAVPAASEATPARSRRM